MYNVYLNNVLCPVAPGKISVSYGKNCSVVELADGGEVSIPSGNLLRVVEFSLLLPNSEYPFAVYRSGFQKASRFLEKFESFLHAKEPIGFIVVRQDQGGRVNGLINMKCLIEGFQVVDDAAQGSDVVVHFKLREYRNFFTKRLELNSSGAVLKSARPDGNSPAPRSQSLIYRVVKGDCLWLIAKRFYGDGDLYPKIYEANKGVLKGRSPRCLIFAGDTLEIPI